MNQFHACVLLLTAEVFDVEPGDDSAKVYVRPRSLGQGLDRRRRYGVGHLVGFVRFQCDGMSVRCVVETSDSLGRGLI